MYVDPLNHGILTPLPMVFWPLSPWYIWTPYPWYIEPISMVFQTLSIVYLLPYPWYFNPPTSMVYRPPYRWYIAPPTHGILTPLPMVFWPPLPMVYQSLSYGIMDPSLLLEIKGSIHHEGVQNTMTKIDPGVKISYENWP